MTKSELLSYLFECDDVHHRSFLSSIYLSITVEVLERFDVTYHEIVFYDESEGPDGRVVYTKLPQPRPRTLSEEAWYEMLIALHAAIEEKRERIRRSGESNRLVDYLTYHEWAGKHGAMGSFTNKALTPLGSRCLEEARRFIGRVDYRGANKRGMYLKWEVRGGDDEVNILLFRDWLLDNGINVVLNMAPIERGRYSTDGKEWNATEHKAIRLNLE